MFKGNCFEICLGEYSYLLVRSGSCKSQKLLDSLRRRRDYRKTIRPIFESKKIVYLLNVPLSTISFGSHPLIASVGDTPVLVLVSPSMI